MDKRLPFLSHLAELRKTVLVCVAVLVAAAALCMPFAGRVLQMLQRPAAGEIPALYYFGPEEAFLVYMRIGFFCAVILASPVIFYSIWHFISPALPRRGGALPFIAVCAAAFLCGCLFSYFILLPSSLRFLLSIGGSSLRPLISASRYVSFVTGLTLACGAVFLMPACVYFLARAHLVTASFLRRHYAAALVVILVGAAVITPTADMFNMLAVAVPMVCLYEISIWIAFFAGRCGSMGEEAYG
jgi:sec-independent protein translocase protein TatC